MYLRSTHTCAYMSMEIGLGPPIIRGREVSLLWPGHCDDQGRDVGRYAQNTYGYVVRIKHAVRQKLVRKLGLCKRSKTL